VPARGGVMDRFLFSVDKISLWMGRAFGWCIMIGAVGSTYEVISTKLFRLPTVWAFDLSYMMYGCLFMMAGAYALSRDSHVRADVIYRLLGPRYQASIEMFLYIIFFFPGVLALVYAGSRYAWQSYTFNEKSVMSVAWFPIFHFKFIIPIAGVLLVFQGIAQVIRCGLCLRDGAWPTHLQDVEELERVAVAQHDAEADAPQAKSP
jgi:TRAP-type mannitol/chloroaromatic compound transport system permease small subunit